MIKGRRVSGTWNSQRCALVRMEVVCQKAMYRTIAQTIRFGIGDTFFPSTLIISVKDLRSYEHLFESLHMHLSARELRVWQWILA